MITVPGAGSAGSAGSTFHLQCAIFLPTGVTVSELPIVQWIRPSGGSATGNVVSAGVLGGSSFYISQLIFDPLTLSDGGGYTCTATYSLGRQTSPSVMDTSSISVVSKGTKRIILTIIMIIIIIYKFLFYSTRAISDFASERYNRCRYLSWRRHNSYM